MVNLKLVYKLDMQILDRLLHSPVMPHGVRSRYAWNIFHLLNVDLLNVDLPTNSLRIGGEIQEM